MILLFGFKALLSPVSVECLYVGHTLRVVEVGSSSLWEKMGKCQLMPCKSVAMQSIVISVHFD